MLNQLKQRIRTQPLKVGCLLFALLSLFWLPTAWWMSGLVVNAEAERFLVLLQARRVAELDRVSRNLGSRLEYLKGSPEIVANTLEIRRALAAPDAGLIGDANRYLNIFASNSLADKLWVLDTGGRILMANDAGERGSLLGAQLPARFYFSEAINGRRAMQFSYGMRTGIPGFYFSAPVLSGKKVIGVVVLKVEVGTLDKVIDTPDLLLSDADGVIVLARDPEQRLRTLPKAKAATFTPQQLKYLYDRPVLAPMSLTPTEKPIPPGLFHLDGSATPYLLLTRDDPQMNGLRVHILMAIRSFENLPERLLFYFWLIGGCGLALAALALMVALYLLRTRLLSRQLALANRELRQQAETDFLTGCANRRKFDRVLVGELARSQRYGNPLTLALIDIDHFKRINDDHGHPAGDAALVHLVDTVKAGIREADLFGRVGGEEFGLLLPQTPASGAALLLDRLRQHIEQRALQTDGGAVAFTISIGYAVARAGDDADSLRARADAALYVAKQGGRNRVCMEHE
ncbi:hypothetical protein JHS3_20260 [Jeongeupia sp. HS-3]|uniref:sensor domain-containing diguanylate cyclase n=1 Tax=Jeongeupia sp. HS-3 TaxID=1009682 RepID=UPI0018A67918|nr:sensor domain-containing diguanylate cyclase [Jeongeupia sp. HS-3]BCL76290.1 hypothetical protein JHS3_20260 [Jeongeupia sp. HS-3]